MATLESLNTRVISLEGQVTDIAAVMQDGFSRMDRRFDALESGINELDARMGTVEVGLGKLTLKVDEMAEDLSAVAEAVSKDAETLIDHERRIGRLERA